MFRLKKVFKNKEAQTMVETALVLPIILMLLFGIIEFGRIFNAHMIMKNASRDGARCAAVGEDYEDDITPKINNMTSTLGTVNIEFTPAEDSRVQGDEVTCKVTYELQLITPIIGPLISGSNKLDVVSSTTMRIE